jgi:ATP-binding cassette, subfamily B, heavy metal transporter
MRAPHFNFIARDAKSRRSVLSLLLPYLWPAHRMDLRLRIAGATLCMLLASAATASSPLILAALTDDFTRGAVNTGALIAAYAASRVLTELFAQLRDFLFVDVQYHAMRDMGRRAFAHIHALSLRFHLERKTGGLIRSIERGLRAVNTFLSYAAFNTIPVLLQLLFFTAEFIWKLNAQIALVALAAVAAYVLFTIAVTRRQAQLRRAVNARDTEAVNKMIDSLLNYETVKYFGAEAHERARFDGAMAGFARTMFEAEKSLAFLNVGQSAIMAVGMGAIMALTAAGISDGVFTLGAFVLGVAILVQLYQPLTVLGTVYHEIVQSFADLEGLSAILDLPLEVQDKPGAKNLVVTRGEIRFDGVVFAYEPGNVALKSISFRIPPGKTVAIVGPSGAGKSTVSRILNRFYDITAGSVTIDGQDIRDVTQASLRAAIGVVPQDAGLFHDTIRYNIAYGRPDASGAEIEDAARLAQIDTFIRTLPLGYGTPVGERGLMLSGGEKQRVAIARAILKDAPILLLDEATSALDTHTERAVQSALAAARAKRTSLIIAHRLSTVVDADEILVLEHGAIIERGTHAELLAKAGRYAAMWNRQKAVSAAREQLAEPRGV